MKEAISTLTTKGRVTIPAEVRRHLGLKPRDKIAFVIEDEGEVRLKVPRYSNVASLSTSFRCEMRKFGHGSPAFVLIMLLACMLSGQFRTGN